MAFGSSANTQQAHNNNVTYDKTAAQEVFLNTKEGIKILRLPVGSDEIKVKRHWLALNEDGTWEPHFGFNPTDKRRKTTIIVAYWDVGASQWVGDSANWRNNPIDKYVNSLEEEDRNGKYAQERFYLNVIDLTPVKMNGTNVVYPDTKFQYPDVPDDAPRIIVGKMRVLEGSSGELERTNKKTGKREAGKSMYAYLMRGVRGVLSDEGEPVAPFDYNIRFTTTGTGIGTVYEFRPAGDPKPLDKQYASLPMYDLQSFVKPWPNDAIQELLDGGDYGEVVKKYNIKLYPDLMTENTNTPSGEDAEEEGLFD